jgi:signal peptidase I
MAPSVKDGDVVLYYRPDKSYEQGDMAVLSYEGTLQVRRVVAVEGDSVDITKDGLVINGALQQEPDIYEETLRYTEGPILPLTLGKGEVFVLGDARKGATDSRAYGPVPAKDTLGTVIATIRHRGL